MLVDISTLPANIRPTAERLLDTISFSENITKGANGYVLVGHHRVLDRMVVVKFYYWGSGVHIEPALLARLESPNVLKVDHAEVIDDDDAFFITRFCAAGDIDDELLVRRFGPREALDAIVQIAAGVSYLHGQGYLHRDLKPSNLFVTDDGVRVIGDFGSVVQIGPHDYAETQSKHSIIYRPPEDFKSAKYYRQGDIYQLGLVFYQLMGGFLPYPLTDWLTIREQQAYDGLSGLDQQLFGQEKIEARILGGRVLRPETLPPFVPDCLKRVLRRACHPNFTKRYEKAADLIGALNNLRSRVPDWRVEGSTIWIDDRNRTFRVVPNGESFSIEKRKEGLWRMERSLHPSTLREAVEMVEKQLN